MIYIVIPVFNRWSFTEACLTSLGNQTYKEFKVIVIDHGSTDGTSDFIKSGFPNVIVLKGNQDMWWTAATNLGIKYALNKGASYVVTLNNDTLAESDYVDKLMASSKNASANALIGSTAIDGVSGQVNYRGEKIDWFWESSIQLSGVKRRPDNGLLNVTHFPGRGLLISREVFLKIGLFDEQFFPHYMADYDFTLRAIRSSFDVYCSWDAKLTTYPDASGANQLKQRRTFDGYKQHLFGIRGGGNLPLFFKFAFRHCPMYALPSHLILGTLRRLLGYWIKK